MSDNFVLKGQWVLTSYGKGVVDTVCGVTKHAVWNQAQKVIVDSAEEFSDWAKSIILTITFFFWLAKTQMKTKKF